jgi:DNA-binding CsgD family transcriptional regulator
MGSTTAADLRRVLRYAELAVEVSDFGAVGPVLLRGLAELVGADSAMLQEVDLTGGPRVLAVGWPAEQFTLRHAEGYAPVLTTHPLVVKCSAQSPEQGMRSAPVRVSDLLSRRDWRASLVYQQTHWRFDDEMSHIVDARGSALRGIWLARGGRSFTDRERDLLALTRRHVAVALRRVHRDQHRALQILPQPAWVPVAVAPARPAAAASAALSGREREVLALVARGLTDVQLGRRLGISPRTVGKHLERVYAKLGVPNRAAAVAHLSPAGTH